MISISNIVHHIWTLAVQGGLWSNGWYYPIILAYTISLINLYLQNKPYDQFRGYQQGSLCFILKASISGKLDASNKRFCWIISFHTDICDSFSSYCKLHLSNTWITFRPRASAARCSVTCCARCTSAWTTAPRASSHSSSSLQHTFSSFTTGITKYRKTTQLGTGDLNWKPFMKQLILIVDNFCMKEWFFFLHRKIQNN